MILGYGDKILGSTSWPAVLQGTASPVGSVTPNFIGQRYTDGVTMWDAVGLTSADWATSGGGGGVTDHTELTSIGTNTHDQIDTALTRLSNTSGTNTGDETATTIKTALGITTLSGSNTGDQDLSGYVPKSGTTMTGTLVAKANDATASRVFNIHRGTTNPVAAGVGDTTWLWLDTSV